MSAIPEARPGSLMCPGNFFLLALFLGVLALLIIAKKLGAHHVELTQRSGLSIQMDEATVLLATPGFIPFFAGKNEC